MISWISILAVELIITVLLYAIISVFLGKPIGLYVATVLHIALGIISLPSIGLYVLGLAILELIIGVIVSIKFRNKRLV